MYSKKKKQSAAETIQRAWHHASWGSKKSEYQHLSTKVIEEDPDGDWWNHKGQPVAIYNYVQNAQGEVTYMRKTRPIDAQEEPEYGLFYIDNWQYQTPPPMQSPSQQYLEYLQQQEEEEEQELVQDSQREFHKVRRNAAKKANDEQDQKKDEKYVAVPGYRPPKRTSDTTMQMGSNAYRPLSRRHRHFNARRHTVPTTKSIPLITSEQEFPSLG